MSLFRSRRPGGTSGPDDDPTQVLAAWREQQREERLADTREFPDLVDTAPATAPPARRRRVPLLLAVGVGALVVVGAVAVASAVTGPDGPTTGSAAVTTAPTTTAPGDGATTGSTPSDAPTAGSTDAPGGEADGPGVGDSDGPPAPGDANGPPAPPSGGPGADGGPGTDGGPGADAGPGTDGGPAAGGGPGAAAPAPPGR